MKKGKTLGGIIIVSGLITILAITCGIIILHKHTMIKDCTEDVQAIIADIKTVTTSGEDLSEETQYYNVYQYNYQDILFTGKSTAPKRKAEAIGTVVTIKINPNNPKQFRDDDMLQEYKIEKAVIIALTVMLVLILFSIIYALYQLHREQQENNEEEVKER